MRILVVDDDRAVRESLRRSLEFNGYSVQLAEDGQRALHAVARQRPDAMVLDMMMPMVDGVEVCRRLRSAGDDLPMLMLTARDEVSDRVAGLDAGADDYLSKPFLLEELLARLHALLRRSTPGRPRDSGAGRTSEDSDLSVDAAASDSSPIEASVTHATRAATLSRRVKRHVSFKIRLSSTIIGLASVVVAAIGLVPPFVGAFGEPNPPDFRPGHSDATRCIKIGNVAVSFVNGIPQGVAEVRVGMEVRAVGHGFSYWLVMMLILTDGNVYIERKQIEEISDVMIFPLDFLPEETKRHNLMVDVDILGIGDVPLGVCS